jgi:hypothetical protein
MAYAVVQTRLEPISAAQLAAAFQQVPSLTALDSQTLGRDAYGVLVRGLEWEQSSAMWSALAAQGIEAEIVEEAALPELPLPRQLTRADFASDALVIHDFMGRSLELPWNDISVLAAGRVPLTEFVSEQKIRVKAGMPFPGKGARLEVVTENETKEEQHNHLLLEIITRGAALRYHTVADRPETLLLFQCLGERRSREPLLNLSLFVQEVAKLSRGIILNYGAYNLCENRDPSFSYESKGAFYREITWLLWMLSTGRLQQ